MQNFCYTQLDICSVQKVPRGKKGATEKKTKQVNVFFITCKIYLNVLAGWQAAARSWINWIQLGPGLEFRSLRTEMN